MSKPPSSGLNQKATSASYQHERKLARGSKGERIWGSRSHTSYLKYFFSPVETRQCYRAQLLLVFGFELTTTEQK